MRKALRIIETGLLLIPTYVFGEITYSDLETETSTAVKTGVHIVESIIGLVLAIGLMNAIYQTASGKHESREKIIGWGIGVLIYIIGIIIINKIVL